PPRWGKIETVIPRIAMTKRIPDPINHRFMTNLLICAKTISPQPDGAGRASFQAMSSRLSRMLSATVLLCAVTAAWARHPPIAVSELEQRINALLNGERRARSLKPLDWDQDLSKIARAPSQDMANRGFCG